MRGCCRGLVINVSKFRYVVRKRYSNCFYILRVFERIEVGLGKLEIFLVRLIGLVVGFWDYVY